MIAAGVLVGTALAPLAPATPATAAPPIYMEDDLRTQGPRGSIAVVGDSVLLGSVWSTGGYGPSLGQMLSAAGWGPVTSKAGVGFQTGRFLTAGHGANMTTWLAARRRAGWDADVFAVALGANEVTTCRRDVACAVVNVERFLDAVGPGHQVWWSKITMPDPADAATWNAALDDVAARRSELVVWDWPGAIAATGIPVSGDGVHLPTAAAYRWRSQLIADDVTARRGTSSPVAHAGPAFAPSGPPLRFDPVAPARVLDTRTSGERIGNGGTLVVDLAAHVPTGAQAVAVNLAVDGPTVDGFLTAWPCDAERPVTSALNTTAGVTRSAHAIVRLDAARRFCVFASGATDVIVNLQGVLTPGGGNGLAPFSPERLVDTRLTGRRDVVRVATPAGATAVAVNVTVTDPAAPGFVTAFPCDAAMPTVANANFRVGETVGGAAFVSAGSGEICVFTNTPADVIVDLTGTFEAAHPAAFVPATATRLLDTRDGTGGWRGRTGPGQTLALAAAPGGAVAISGTLTAVRPALTAHLTAHPCGSALPPTASVNAGRGAIVANSVTVGLGAPSEPGGHGRLCVAAPVNTDVVLDLTGWWTE